MGMKGVSPVIAAVILIAISVAVGVMISGWVMQWVNKEIGGASSCSSYATYRIDSAKYTSSDKNLTIRMTNMGKLGLHGFSVQLINDTHVKIYNSSSPDIKISPNVTATDPLNEQRSAIIIVNVDGIEGDYSSLASTANEIKVLNDECPPSFAKIVNNDITKE